MKENAVKNSTINNNIVNKKRLLHYDLLRIVAAFSVVMLHGAAQFWYVLDVNSKEWLVANSYNALFRFGVPIFVMISGALFLNKEYKLDTKHLYTHNILRLAVIYIVWSCVYGVYDSRTYDLQVAGIKPLLRELITGRYHLWFLPMIIGLYMLLPILKSWLAHAEKQIVQYFFGLFFLFQICSETLRALTVSDEVHYLIDIAKIDMVCSYLGYFVWGYYLAHVGLSGKVKKIFYIAMLPSALCNVLLGNYLSLQAGLPKAEIYDSYGLFTFVIVTGVFLLATDKASKINLGQKMERVIGEISADTLGVYLLHVGLMEILEQQGIHNMLLPNVIGIPVHVVLCFVLSMIIAAALRRIPVIGRFLC